MVLPLASAKLILTGSRSIVADAPAAPGPLPAQEPAARVPTAEGLELGT